MLNTVDTVVYKIQSILSKTSLSGRGGGQESALLPHIMVAMFVQLLSRVQLFTIPWTAVHHASLSFTISQSLLKLMSIESMMPSSHLILCRPLLLLPSVFPNIWVFAMSQFFEARGQSTGVSASASVLPMNIQD